MIRAFAAHSLALLMAFTGHSLASAQGRNSDIGMEIVICFGVTMKTITIGADGQPIEKTHICPDGTSIFTAAFALPQLVPPAPRLLALGQPLPPVLFTSRNELSPSARGPPALV